jgi:two-component system, OmpR family, response regulator VicR
MKVLIVEDSPAVVETISLALEMRWPDSKIIATSLGQKGIDRVETDNPDVVILDLGLPDIDGFEVVKRIRLFSRVPILILTVRSDESDIVKGLEWGADDYMVKPFRQLELLARVKTIMKRSGSSGEEPLTIGPIRFDPVSNQLTKGGKEVLISRTEGLILGHLMRNAGKAVSHTSIAERIWEEDYPDAVDAIKVHIRHLREKLEEDPGHPELIITKSGIGYLFSRPTM